MRRSKGELLIESYLKENNIDYSIEHTFSWLSPQRCDFFCKDYYTVIEVDGAQHYKDSNFFASLEKQQKQDKKKDNLCTSYGFQVIRIPYNKLKLLKSETLIYMITHPKYGKVRNLKNLVGYE